MAINDTGVSGGSSRFGVHSQVWLGGSPANIRTAFIYQDRMKDANMEEVMEPILR